LSDNNNVCKAHSGILARVNSNEMRINTLFVEVEKNDKEIDKMKNWVIAGMAGLILQLIIFIGSLITLFLR